MDLIKTLKEEHSQILSLFDQIDQLTDTAKIKELTTTLADIVTKHLYKEDTILYPNLAKSKNEEIQHIGSVFSSTMPDYVKDFTSVVTTILNTQEITPEILTQYQKIRDKIKNRVTVEETILFPSFEL
jgi:iron-sulfur cluster repair protein YtfE (RIC family)